MNGYVLTPPPAPAPHPTPIHSSTTTSGRVGKLAVESLLKRGKAVRAVTRTGDFYLGSGGGGGAGGGDMTSAAGDVTKSDTLKQALAGCGAVLFCASASKVLAWCWVI